METEIVGYDKFGTPLKVGDLIFRQLKYETRYDKDNLYYGMVRKITKENASYMQYHMKKSYLITEEKAKQMSTNPKIKAYYK